MFAPGQCATANLPYGSSGSQSCLSIINIIIRGQLATGQEVAPVIAQHGRQSSVRHHFPEADIYVDTDPEEGCLSRPRHTQDTGGESDTRQAVPVATVSPRKAVTVFCGDPGGAAL